MALNRRYLFALLFCSIAATWSAAQAGSTFQLQTYPPNPDAMKALAAAQLDLEQRRNGYEIAISLGRYLKTSPEVAKFMIDRHLIVDREPSFVPPLVRTAYETVINSGQLSYLPAYYREYNAKHVPEAAAAEFLLPALEYVGAQNTSDGAWSLRTLAIYWFYNCEKSFLSTKCYVTLPKAGQYFKQAMQHPLADTDVEKDIAEKFADNLFQHEKYPEAAGWYLVELDLLKMSQFPDPKDMNARAAYMQKLYAQHGASVPLQDVIGEVQRDDLLKRVKDSDRIWHRLDLIRQNGFQAADPFAGS